MCIRDSFLPISVYALPLAACALKRLPWPGRWRAALAGVLACLLAATSAVNSLYFSRRDITYEPRMALESLLAEGYDCGYATFWRANVLTELSGGEVEMYCLEGPYEDVYKRQVKSMSQRTSETLSAWKNDTAVSQISLYTKDVRVKNVSRSPFAPKAPLSYAGQRG